MGKSFLYRSILKKMLLLLARNMARDVGKKRPKEDLLGALAPNPARTQIKHASLVQFPDARSVRCFYFICFNFKMRIHFSARGFREKKHFSQKVGIRSYTAFGHMKHRLESKPRFVKKRRF